MYQTQRWFIPKGSSPASYRIPLPPGHYQVALRFAEVHDDPKPRVFDVLLGGDLFLERYKPLTAGFATADRRSTERNVEDGYLDIGFSAETGNPTISGIEIDRLDYASLAVGKKDSAPGISLVPHKDGMNDPGTGGPEGDRRALRINRKGSMYYYFLVTDPFLKGCRSLSIRGVFYDDPEFQKAPLAIPLDYTNAAASGAIDLRNAFFLHPVPLLLRGTGGWVSHTWRIPDAGFRTFMQGVADFRFGLSTNLPQQLCLERVEVFVERAAPRPAVGPGRIASVDFGETDEGNGLSLVEGDDGVNPPGVCGPEDDRRRVRINGGNSAYCYFLVTNASIQKSEALSITATFFDDPAFLDRPVEIGLHFTRREASGPEDTANVFAAHPVARILKGEGRWVPHTWHVLGAGFRKIMQGSRDFRLAVSRRTDQQVCLNRVEVAVIPPSLVPLVEKVERLFEEHGLADAVATALAADPALDAADRERALALAREHGIPSPLFLNSASWKTAVRPDATPEEYLRALRQAEAASEMRPSAAFIVNTLGVAQYRAGQYREALATLTRSSELTAQAKSQYDPAGDLVFIAMCRFRLGDAEKARAVLEEARAAASKAKVENPELKAFLMEAEALLGNPK